MLSEIPTHEREEMLKHNGLDIGDLKNIRIVHHLGNPTIRRQVEMLPVSGFTSCLIFAPHQFEKDTMHADCQVIASMLLIRDLQHRAADKQTEGASASASNDSLKSEWGQSERVSMPFNCPVITEVLDPRTQSILASNRTLATSSEFCMSNKVSDARWLKPFLASAHPC